MTAPGPTVDCAIVGAGPAGLTAALYLARFRRNLIVYDAGRSRASWIPTSHNCPGFPEGLSGDDLLGLLRRQAGHYGVRVLPARVQSLRRDGSIFVVAAEGQPDIRASTVVLATGLVDVMPDASWAEEAVACGALRLCAICDGYEAQERSVAVYGPLDSALGHARFMRTYTRSVTVVASDGGEANAEQRAQAAADGLAIEEQAGDWTFDRDRCVFVAGNGERREYQVVYAALGSHTRSQLALNLGADADDNGELVVDAQQATSVPGLYAIGDVVSALNQIAVGQGHAVIASSAIHRRLPDNPC